MKHWIGFALTLSLLPILAACQKAPVEEAQIVGKTYCYEQEGFGGDFTITIHEDGTYTLYEGYLSSSFGNGTWTLEDSLLTLKDSYLSTEYHFQAEEDQLLFQAEDSDPFLFVEVQDGESFHQMETPPSAIHSPEQENS